MKKVIVCLVGVVNRSITSTWASINNNIVDQLKKEYEVHIAVFNNNVEECRVDGELINNKGLSIIPCDHMHECEQTSVDEGIAKTSAGKWRWVCGSGCGQNGLRQMYMESKVSKFLAEHKDTYEYAVVSNPDYFYTNKLSLEWLEHVDQETILTCHHKDFGGITDGFCLGHPESVSKIMARIHFFQEMRIGKLNYEKILQCSFDFNSTKRHNIGLMFAKIRADGSVYGRLW